ncbi:hypothetical protein DFH09DRAFT_981932 [Mycena vulgaris]|nr:hypothetical protein DFH09DRAFT_981932 [Mycena vulgaris]
MVSNNNWVDRRGASRTVPMRVLVLGFCRTGTSSMREALKTLGYKDTHHGMAVISNPPEADMWTAPQERVLEYEVGEGWDRLCAFLGDDVPNTDFPRVNDTKAILQTVDTWTARIFRRTAIRLAVPCILLVSLCVAVYAPK